MGNEKDFKIARFIDLSACKRIFSNYSTFVLRSPEYYRNMENKRKRDKAEGSIEHKNEQGQIYQSERMNYLISCWTMLKGDEPSYDEWMIFDDDKHPPILALISTPEKVAKCIKKKMRIDKDDSLYWRVEHKEVIYYEKGTYQDSDKVFEGFYKGNCFSEEKEYRFVVNVKNHIDTLMFYAEPEEYCDTAMMNTKTVECFEFYKAYENGVIVLYNPLFIKNFKKLIDLVGHSPCTYPR